MGNTAIDSSLGTTVTGALETLRTTSSSSFQADKLTSDIAGTSTESWSTKSLSASLDNYDLIIAYICDKGGTTTDSPVSNSTTYPVAYFKAGPYFLHSKVNGAGNSWTCFISVRYINSTSVSVCVYGGGRSCAGFLVGLKV